MASILRVNTLTDASSNNSIATSTIFNGSAKLYVRKPADGASNPDSFNVSSIDDDGTGDFGINISSAMSNATYTITGEVYPVNNTTVISTLEIDPFANITTTSFDGDTAYANSTNDRTNYDYDAGIAIHGDLA